MNQISLTGLLVLSILLLVSQKAWGEWSKKDIQTLVDLHFPGGVFIDNGACTGPCCSYGPMRANREVLLVGGPGGKEVINRVIDGEEVMAVSGEVHVFPRPLEVLKDQGRYKKGHILFRLTREGNGNHKVYYGGRFYSSKLGESDDWWRSMGKGESKENVWWIKVKTSEGKTAWSNEPDGFDGKKDCRE